MDDIEYLVDKAANGDRLAFESLYRQTCRAVYFTCLSFLKNEQEAADVTQDVYLTVLEELPTLNDKSKFIPWLNRIAVNKCNNFLTKKKPILMDNDDLEGLQIEENENFLPEEYITNQEKRKIVMDIMRNKLSDILYQTVIMYYFNGISVAEIAGIMNCPVGTVTYRLSVARAKIKEGVLHYEKKNDDKLYAFAGVPFLTSLLAAEMQGIEVPNILPGIINTVSKSAATAQIAKEGAHTMLKTLKAKIITGVAAVAIVGGGITAAVVISNKDDRDDGPEITSEADSLGETTVKIEISDDTEAESEINENTDNTASRWLLQQDFSTGQLDSAPTDFTLFNEKIAAPIDIEDIKQNFESNAFLLPIGAGNGVSPEKIEGTSEEVLNLDGYYFADWDSKPGVVYLYSKGADKWITHINIYNFSDQEMSVKESVDNSWWDFYLERNFEEFFGLSEDDIKSDEENTDKAIMAYLIDKLGSPNYLNLEGTVETFLDNASEENSLDSYELAWIFDDYVLYLYCYDKWFYNKNTFEICSVEYFPREVWEELELKDKENQIDELFK